MIRLYGHYGSQPFRSVAWLLKINEQPFEFIKVDPTTGATKSKEYLSKFPLGLIPAVEDVEENFRLSEGSAIMIYLCQKYGWETWYPSNSNTQTARIHEYMSHHNEGTRTITRKVFRPVLERAILRKGVLTDEDSFGFKEIMSKRGKIFQDAFLSRSKFIAGESPTIADLLAYTEIAQVNQAMGFSYVGLPRLQTWLNEMSHLPHHDDVHRTVFKMGGIISGQISKL
uniref:Glutathione S-transferase n=1 Tax=Pseudictyota dubia TaxID=2749911 RepID=A0A7R9ZE42_9STRA